jgi:hypothetical protein
MKSSMEDFRGEVQKFIFRRELLLDIAQSLRNRKISLYGKPNAADAIAVFDELVGALEAMAREPMKCTPPPPPAMPAPIPKVSLY